MTTLNRYLVYQNLAENLIGTYESILLKYERIKKKSGGKLDPNDEKSLKKAQETLKSMKRDIQQSRNRKRQSEIIEGAIKNINNQTHKITSDLNNRLHQSREILTPTAHLLPNIEKNSLKFWKNKEKLLLKKIPHEEKKFLQIKNDIEILKEQVQKAEEKYLKT